MSRRKAKRKFNKWVRYYMHYIDSLQSYDLAVTAGARRALDRVNRYRKPIVWTDEELAEIKELWE